ncbi:hypothetical protein SVIOM74S_01036 [Streptomyces violarus]
MEVQGVRGADPLLVDLLERAARGAAYDLAGQRPADHRVIAERRAGTPERPLVGEAFGELAVVGQLREGEAAVRADHARPVREQIAQGQGALALGRELRPVVRHFAVQFERAVLDEEGDDQVGGSLGRREHAVEGVRFRPRPQVDHLAAVNVGAQLALVVGALPGHERGELLAHRLEAVGYGAVDLLRHPLSSTEPLCATVNNALATCGNSPSGWSRKSGSVPNRTVRAPLTTEACPAAAAGPPVPSRSGRRCPETSGFPIAYD